MKTKSIIYYLLFLCISICIGFATTLILFPNAFATGLKTIFASSNSFMLFIGISIISFIFLIVWWRKIESSIDISRNSNLELCRVVCMLLIIAHHSVVHGGIINIESMTTNKFLSFLLIPGGKLCFDCFIAISCWFLGDQKFKMERFLKMWLLVLFYSVSFTAIACAMGTEITWYNWFSVFLPISGNSHGFAASYLGFYLLIPFLNKLTKNITKKQARILLALIFYFEVGTQVIGYFAQYRQPMASELFVFILCYLIALNLKRWPIRITENKYIMLSIFVIIWIILWLARYFYVMDPTNKFGHFILSTMCDESSLSNIIGGFALFFFFLNLKIPKIKLINLLASGTFGILLIHDHNFFRYNLWSQIIKASTWYEQKHFLLIIFLFVVWIFTVGTIIDQIRNHYLEKKVIKSSLYRNICKKFNSIFDSNNENDK